MRTTIHFPSYLAQFCVEWEVFQVRVLEEIKAHFVLSNLFFFRNSYRVWENVEKYCRAGKAIDGNMSHAHCVLGAQGYTHSQYVIFISLPPQQWLDERVSMFRLYAHCLPFYFCFKERSFVVIGFCPLLPLFGMSWLMLRNNQGTVHIAFRMEIVWCVPGDFPGGCRGYWERGKNPSRELDSCPFRPVHST